MELNAYLVLLWMVEQILVSKEKNCQQKYMIVNKITEILQGNVSKKKSATVKTYCKD